MPCHPGGGRRKISNYVATRIILFLGGNPNQNHHLWLLLGGGGTLQGTNISQLGNGNIILKTAFVGDMLAFSFPEGMQGEKH